MQVALKGADQRLDVSGSLSFLPPCLTVSSSEFDFMLAFRGKCWVESFRLLRSLNKKGKFKREFR